MAKILIVEDDALLAHMYSTEFTKSGYEVSVAENGQAGLDVARTYHPSLILLDIMMPKMNGMQALEKLKADDALSSIPVVVLTNLAGNSDIDRAMGLGATRYVIKSENRPKQVEEIVHEVLEANQTPHSAE
jgi:CheY-like chemotaxis protein